MTVREPASAPDRDVAESRRITVVNNNPAFLELIGELLKTDAGYTVTLLNGDDLESIEPIRAATPDLLIVDLRMEDARLSGWDILTAVRADSQLTALPVLICTADTWSLKEHAEELARVPHVEVLTKPFAIGDLQAVVRRMLGEPT
jgi:CheY-like chemotaxis protein